MAFDYEQTPTPHTVEGLRRVVTPPPAPDPTMNRKKYATLSAAAQWDFNEERLARISWDIRIPTPQTDQVVRAVQKLTRLNEKRQTGRVGLAVSGLGGVGKTTAALLAADWQLRDMKARLPEHERLGYHPVVFSDMPAAATPKSMLSQLAYSYGLQLRRAASAAEIQQAVVQVMNACRTKLVIVDEVHQLSASNNGTRETSDALKSLMNAATATFLLSGIGILDNHPIFEGVHGHQLKRRFTGVRLGDFGYSSEIDVSIWNGILVEFAPRLLLLNQPEGAILELSSYLYERTRGSIRSLGMLLVSAAQQLISETEGDASHEHIDKAILDTIDLDIESESARGPAFPTT